MNDIAHQQMVQETLKKKFGRKKYLQCRTKFREPAQAEREYTRTVNAYIRSLNEVLKEYLPKLKTITQSERKDGMRYDASPDDIRKLNELFDKMAEELERKTAGFALFDKIEAMAHLTRKLTIREWKRACKATLGVDLMDDYYSGELYERLMKQWVDENVSLIKTIPRETLGTMHEIAEEGFWRGETTTSIFREMQRQYGIGRRHAQFIARDQISKLNGDITRYQQEDAGVTEYIWSTSGDSRVRESHARLNGKKFKWSDPPVVDEKTGRRCHPGEDYQCRCVALPVFNISSVDLPIVGENNDK